jgi:hypothetical protein
MYRKIIAVIVFLSLAGCASQSYTRALVNWQTAQRDYPAYITWDEYKAAQAEYNRENNIRIRPLVAGLAVAGMAFGNMPTMGTLQTHTVKTGDGAYTTTYSNMVYK